MTTHSSQIAINKHKEKYYINRTFDFCGCGRGFRTHSQRSTKLTYVYLNEILESPEDYNMLYTEATELFTAMRQQDEDVLSYYREKYR